VKKIKYDPEFRKQLGTFFSVKDTEIRNVIKEIFNKVRQRREGDFWWNSIESEDLLTEEERNLQKNNNG
jgi:hypothetical protein